MNSGKWPFNKIIHLILKMCVNIVTDTYTRRQDPRKGILSSGPGQSLARFTCYIFLFVDDILPRRRRRRLSSVVYFVCVFP